jgi:hypothetical protein
MDGLDRVKRDEVVDQRDARRGLIGVDDDILVTTEGEEVRDVSRTALMLSGVPMGVSINSSNRGTRHRRPSAVMRTLATGLPM